VLSTDPSVARERRRRSAPYADLPNYRNNWKRLGFTDDEIERREPALDAWWRGRRRRDPRALQAHHDAGATHVHPAAVGGPRAGRLVLPRGAGAC
jgi:hypothetical protein